MEKYTKLLQKKRDRKADYIEKLKDKKFKRLILTDEIEELNEEFDETNERINNFEITLENIAENDANIEETKACFKKEGISSALGLIGLLLITNALTLYFSNLPITIFLFFTSLFGAAVAAYPFIKYPILLAKYNTYKKNYKASAIEESLKSSRESLREILKELSECQNKREKIDEIIDGLNKVIGCIELEINQIKYARNSASKKLGDEASDLEYNKIYEQDKVIKNILRLERVKKHDK